MRRVDSTDWPRQHHSRRQAGIRRLLRADGFAHGGRIEARGGWLVRDRLTACVSVDEVNDEPSATDLCGPIVRWQGRTYVASVGEPALGPGSILGNAVIPGCASLPTPDDKLHPVLGAIRPATAYSETTPNDHIVLVVNRHPVGYSLVSEESARVAVRSHCGVTSVTVRGRLWLADPSLGNHKPPPGWSEIQTLGYLVVTSPDRPEFYGDGQVAQFRLAPADTADPGAGCE